jgi:hypothetical protein
MWPTSSTASALWSPHAADGDTDFEPAAAAGRPRPFIGRHGSASNDKLLWNIGSSRSSLAPPIGGYPNPKPYDDDEDADGNGRGANTSSYIGAGERRGGVSTGRRPP